MNARERLALRIAARRAAEAINGDTTEPDADIELTLAEALTRAVSAIGVPVKGIIAMGHRTPEGVEVTIVGVGVSEADARTVAPEVCRQMEPTRVWGDVLHSEWCESGEHWHVTVEDRGPAGFDGQVH